MTQSLKLEIDFSRPLLFLAPMEGVVDAVLRELLTQYSPLDVCVTEFLRVTSYLHGDEIFYKYYPELRTKCKTSSGTPVLLQLLGSDPIAMAENAAKAVSLGAIGIDLNFGCPAKTVNNHDGGAALLKTPERVFNIISSVRKSVPQHITVSAKIRLGFDNKNYVTDIAQAVDSANASWLCIHARTKVDGYKPPAYWECIAPVKDKVKLPIIANGEVWTKEDYKMCRDRSQAEHVMIGRGLVANPGLASEIKDNCTKKPWLLWQNFLLQFLHNSKNFRHPAYAVQRVKQLTKMMGQTYGESLILHEEIKRLLDYNEVLLALNHHFAQIEYKPIPSPQRILPSKLSLSKVVSPPCAL